MATPYLSRPTYSIPLNQPAASRASLFRLYLVRGLAALAWAAVFARIHARLDGFSIAWLVAYPLIDAISSLIDYRTMHASSDRRITEFNGLLSALAAVGLAVAGNFGPVAVLATFGVWATVSGTAQFALGLSRRGAEFGKQWPMLIAGGLSFLVGISYGLQAAGGKPSLQVLAVYATGGGVFFICQAALLAWRSHQSRASRTGTRG